MESLVLNLILNSTLALLLVVTIVACFRLNTRIRVLQDSKSDLAKLIKQFDETTERATASIVDLQAATKRIGENIQTKIDKANFLADDLSFMIEKGSKIADQMEGGFAGNRGKMPATMPQERPRAAAAPQDTPEPRARGNIKVEPTPPSARSAAPERGSANQSKTNASLESVLERMAGRGGAATETEAPAPKRGAPTARVRSKAEQELFDALKSGR